MHRGRAVIVTLVIAAAAIAGVFAVGRSLSLGNQARAASDAQVARRTAQLDRYQASLLAMLSKQPPALPRSPGAAATSGSKSVPPARVVYRRPPPVVIGPSARSDGDEHGDGRELGGERDDD